jgi:hypothetical protein
MEIEGIEIIRLESRVLLFCFSSASAALAASPLELSEEPVDRFLVLLAKGVPPKRTRSLASGKVLPGFEWRPGAPFGPNRHSLDLRALFRQKSETVP